MSKSWVSPRWWPRDREGRAIVGFEMAVWFFPERDQWRLDCHRNIVGDPMIALGPLRIRFGWFGINRESRGRGAAATQLPLKE